jgi:hypothetical protein
MDEITAALSITFNLTADKYAPCMPLLTNTLSTLRLLIVAPTCQDICRLQWHDPNI